jgi:hypothetical protein
MLLHLWMACLPWVTSLGAKLQIMSSSEPASKKAKVAAVFKLQYFPVFAKGLGPALVAHHSGLKWNGNADESTNVE